MRHRHLTADLVWFADHGNSPVAWSALNDRVTLALTDNFSLAAAWERISEARAIVQFERSALFPEVNAFAEGEVRDGSDIIDNSRVGGGLEASYEVDLWGRIRSIVESERLRAAATAEDYNAAAISLSAEVALTDRKSTRLNSSHSSVSRMPSSA